jgi:hypothetical protein
MSRSRYDQDAASKIARDGLAALLAGTMIVGCSSTAPSRLSECAETGTARFESIPIASRPEHEQALQFTPSSADHCVIYVLRDRDFWTGARARRVAVVLTPTGLSMPRLPAHPSKLPSVFGDRVLEIHDHVYAMWQVPSGSYLLQAFSVSGYGEVFMSQAQGKPGAELGTSRELKCASGEALFFGVGDRGYRHALELKDLESESAKESVRIGLRSAGVHDFDGPGFRDCQLKW